MYTFVNTDVSLKACWTMLYVVQCCDRCQSIVEHWRGGDTGGGTDWVLLTCYPTQWPEEKINPETGRYKTIAPWPDNRRPTPPAYHHSTAYSSWTPINLNTFCEYISFLHDLIKAVYPSRFCALVKLKGVKWLHLAVQNHTLKLFFIINLLNECFSCGK